MYFAYGYNLYFYITWLPTYLLKARHFATDYAGYFSALPWLFGIVAFIIGGHDIRAGSISQGVEALAKRSAVFSRDVLDACRELNVTLLSYSPLEQGLLTGKYDAAVVPIDG